MLFPGLFLGLKFGSIFYTSQDDVLKCGTAHRVLCYLMSIIHEENAPVDVPTGPSNGGIF